MKIAVDTETADVDPIAAEETFPLPESASRRFPIVGIGASAGGLEALQEFFGNMPPNSGLGFVVVTHQHPGHVSMLPNLLAKATEMPVLEADDGQVVEPNHVYVGLPGGLLAISGGVLRRLEAESAKAPHLPIDYFFRSLATDQREHAVCVILSGTGTDGTLGMRAIKAESGMAMVQELPTAKYAGMPSSAAATGLADYVLPAEAMPKQLIAYVKGPYLKPRAPTVEPPAFPKEPLQRILVLLRARTGHDFTCYKVNTIRRRIERRMNVHQIKEPEDYVRYLQENLHEIDMLFGELLISVTGFFRDPAAFEALAERALPDLISARPDDHIFRAWVPGCASGEEAYSLAILIHECMESLKRRFEVQIFGTDLDVHAIEVARAGVYGGGIATDVSKERLDRYFSREDGSYRIRKDLREMLIFAPQNVVRDPPFTKLDLIVCRNLLIYLDAELQKNLLPIFHYALRPGGLLFLGPSESIGGFGELFETVDGKWKIFRRRETAHAAHPMMRFAHQQFDKYLPEAQLSGPAFKVKFPHTISHVERLLLSRFAPTSLVVDERGNILYIHGRTGSYLEPSQGEPRNNVLEMARQGLLRPLTAALRRATRERREVVRENVRVKSNGEFVQVHLAVTWIEEPEPIRGLLLVTLFPAAAKQFSTKGRRGKKEEDAQPTRIDEMEHELQYVKESLQTTIEELETSNEELKSTNEELQSTNEELQSTNEELETSKEEMQSLNEELNTVNAELQSKVEELSHATDDMQNLLNGTQVATVFLDNQLNVKRYTEQAKAVFNLIPTDVGRPLMHLTSNLDYNRLIDDCREVLQTLVCKEVEVRDQAGAWHLVQIMPYRTAENIIDGVVITLVNISRVKEAELEAAAVCQCFDNIVQTAHEPIVLLDLKLRVVSANRAFCRVFDVRPEEAVGKEFFALGNGQWNLPDLRKLLEETVWKGDLAADFKIVHDFPDRGRRAFRLNARRLQRAPESVQMIVLAFTEAMEEPS